MSRSDLVSFKSRDYFRTLTAKDATFGEVYPLLWTSCLALVSIQSIAYYRDINLWYDYLDCVIFIQELDSLSGIVVPVNLLLLLFFYMRSKV